MDFASVLDSVPDVASWRESVVALALGYCLGQLIAFVYAKTYRGLSYSRQMVHTLAVSGILASMLMLAIGNSLARGIGIVGTLALIRFRTNLRDPLDMVFIFASFGAGIAAGTGSYATGVIGTLTFLVAVTIIRVTNFGTRDTYDGMVRLRTPNNAEAEAGIEKILRQECRKFYLVTLREVRQGEQLERAYQFTLRYPGAEGALIEALHAIDNVEGVIISMQEATVEL